MNCQKTCLILPIPQTLSQKIKYTNYIQHTKYKTFHQGQIFEITLTDVGNMFMNIHYEAIGFPERYEIVLSELPSYQTLAPYQSETKNAYLSGLKINTLYEVNVTAFFISGISFGTHSPYFFQTLNQSPPKEMILQNPTGLVSYIGNPFLQVQFSDASGSVDYYQLDIKNNVFKVSPNTLIDLSNVTIDTDYIVTITSFYVNPTNHFSIQKQITSNNETPVTDVRFSNIKGSSMTLTFTKSIGNHVNISYTVLVEDAYTVIQEISNLSFDTDEVLIQLLQYNTTYAFTLVSKYLTSNNSYASNTFLSTTLNESAPIVYDSTLSISSIILKCYPSPNYENVYFIKKKKITDSIYDSTIVSDVTSILFEDLSLNTTYTFLITSIYPSSNEYTTTFQIATLNEGKVTLEDSNITGLTGSTVILTFTPFPNSNPNNYTITCRNASTSTLDVIAFSKSPTVNISNLKPNTTYDILVANTYSSGNTYDETFFLKFTTLNEGPVLTSQIYNIESYGSYITFSVNTDSSYDTTLLRTYKFIITNINTADTFSGTSNHSDIIYINTLLVLGNALTNSTPYTLTFVRLYEEREYASEPIRFTTIDEFPFQSKLNNLIIFGDRFVIPSNNVNANRTDITYSLKLDSLSSYTDYGNISFPYTISNLLSSTQYIATVTSSFTSTTNKYDISYVITTLNESRVKVISFPIDHSGNSAVQTVSNTNPGNNFVKFALLEASGNVISYDVSLCTVSQNSIFEKSYTSSVSQLISKSKTDTTLDINTVYFIKTKVKYAVNTYYYDLSFSTLNEQNVSNIFFYSTETNLALDFVQTGVTQNNKYFIRLNGGNTTANFDNILPPLDISLSPGTYSGYIDTIYISTGNEYRTIINTISDKQAVTTSFLANNSFLLDTSGNIDLTNNEKGITFRTPPFWNITNAIVSRNLDKTNVKFFYKKNGNSNATNACILYLPTILTNKSSVSQNIYHLPNKGYNHSIYKGQYKVSFYVAVHEIEGYYKFGTLFDPYIFFMVALTNTLNSDVLWSDTSSCTSKDYVLYEKEVEIANSCANVEFSIQRLGIEKNNLFIMDVSLNDMF